MLLFDIGANRGDATLAALHKGYNKVIAVEAGPKIFKQLVSVFLYTTGVVCIKAAVSDEDNKQVEFYEAEEDGLSTLNKDWLTSETMPYNGKAFRTITVNTITVDKLVETFGIPDLIKIDVEGAEWKVFRGMTKKYGTVAFEWTYETSTEHEMQLDYLYSLGYREYAPQFIVNHLEEPTEWFPLEESNPFALLYWIVDHEEEWKAEGWKEANLRPTADVGMLWVR